jgi:hypothetical protein
MMTSKLRFWIWPLLALGALLVRTYVTINWPMSLHPALVHDDGLFMRLASEMVAGNWLGSFDQYTLMKGPGYPVFLATASVTGLPLSILHGAFQTLGIALSAYVIARLSGQTALGWFSFVFLMLMPQPFSAEVHRVVRDQIYWSQCLIILAAFGFGILSTDLKKRGMIFWGGLGGGVLSWAWLTREEGLWLVPGILVLLFLGSWRAYRLEHSFVRPLTVCLAAIVSFSIPMMSLMALNKVYYGSFVGVDFKEHNFKAALGALQRIDDGRSVDYVPVSTTARQLAAGISPTFAPLEQSLRLGGPLEGWMVFGCAFYPQTCGDYGGGWFLWAFRDAAALNGFYSSPAKAEEGFSKIAAEIEAACKDGRISCKSGLFDFLPPMSPAQLLSIPQKVVRAWGLIITANASPGILAPPTPATGKFAYYWAFLNFPVAVLPPPESPPETQILGWFYAGDGLWPTFYVEDAKGGRTIVNVTRADSPDLEAFFGSAGAGFNRFSAALPCSVDCKLVAALPVDQFRVEIENNANALLDGKPALWIDAVQSVHRDGVDSILAELNAAKSQTAWVPTSVLTVLSQIYHWLFPAFVVLGVVAFVLSFRLRTESQEVSALLIVAAAAYVLAATRAVILAIIDASWFPAFFLLYALPGIFSIALASAVSIAAAALVVPWLQRPLKMTGLLRTAPSSE